MRIHRSALAVALGLTLAGCVDDWLNTEPQTILTDEQVWNDPNLIISVLGDLYDRLPRWEGLQNGEWERWNQFDEGLTTGQIAGGNIANYGYGSWGAYQWDVLRDLHVAMDGIRNATSSQTAAVRDELLAELRFIRAFIYFEMVKRHGGVPLITEQLIYDFSGDPSYLQVPRAREEEVYDFIYSELNEIKDVLGNEGSKTRANRATALALMSRAMLYAGSIARHNAEMDAPISLPGGEVGIPASRAAEYYQKSLDASRALINGGTHSLNQGPNPAEAFHQIFMNKSNNEVIMARDYLASQGKVHWFSMRGRPKTMKVDQYQNWAGSEIAALLNVAEVYDYLDGTSGLPGVGDGTPEGQANWIFYDDIDGLFQNRDGRLQATLLTPGGYLGSQRVSLQAGVYVWDANLNRYVANVEGDLGSIYKDDGGLWVGGDGPRHQEAYSNATGFYIKKYLDPNPDAGRYSPGSETWWVFFRLGEIYMNAAEAAFELGLVDEALSYINTLRERAGFPPNSLQTLTREKIRSERWAELAYEDHRLWDQKRWRTAHITWDGDPTNPSARLWVLFPYRIVHPGHPNNNKYVYDKFITTQNTAPRFFRMGNYYSEIPQGAINNNPKLVRNPFH